MIKNGNSGNNGLIQEYRIPDMIEYIEDLKILLLSLGFPLLESIVDKKNIENNGIYFLKERNSNAT